MQKPLSVLIVEDSEDDTLLLLRELRRGGYDPDYERVETADALRRALAARQWDLILSDYVIPGFSGLDALRMVRERDLDVPFIVVSGKMGEETAVEVMRAGAHDYILKGRFARMLPAIERELREAEERRHAAREIRNAAEQWQATFDAAHDLFLLLDTECRITRVNKATEKFLGLPAAAIIGKHCFKLIHDRETPPPECPLARLCSSKVHEEAEFLTKEQGVWVSASVDPVFDEHGNLVQIVHIMRDISERKIAEEALRKSEEKYRGIFEGAPVGIFQSTVEGRLLSANPAAVSLFGFDSPEQMIAALSDMVRQIFVSPEQRREMVREVLAADTFIRREVEYRRKDGSVFIANLYVRGVRNDTDEVQFLEGFVEDITERKRTEEAFHAQFRQISTLFDELSVIVYVADLATRELVYLNRYGTSVFGSDWQGKQCDEVLRSDHPLPCPVVAAEPGVQGDGISQHVFERRNRLTGRWYQCVEKKITWGDGRLVTVTVALDITDLKDMVQLKDELLSAVSHEMRTPLTAMCGYIDFILENDVEGSTLREYLTIIQKENQRLNELLSNFLSLQQLKAKPSLGPGKPLALRPLLEEAVRLFMRHAARHRIILEVPPDLPPILVDEGHLHRVLNNLISNAIKYSPKGGDIFVGAQRGENETVTLSVRDEGVGIAPEVLGKIFDRFYQVESGDRRTFSGAGLGLALVRETVTAYGGNVWVESTLGKGSTFFISLPVAPLQRG